jgi:3-hydroxyisobutyrate dehydrogenase-like beta-hydroxyacid dehydrogenase
MGLGIATLLLAHNFRVITNVSDRSAATQNRAKSAGIEQVDSDAELVKQADYILSIVPPKDVPSTAQRILTALKEEGDRARTPNQEALWFLDLNAGSPDTASQLDALFRSQAPGVRFIDGGIIGAPPTRRDDGSWFRPGIPTSGPHRLEDAPVEGARLARVLNTRYLGASVGKASGLKACFAALSKGFTALALQSYTTASSLDVLPDLRHYLDEYNPNARDKAEKSIVGCTGKAYRWVEEMYQIEQTFSRQGGFGDKARVFREIAEVYQGLADLVERQGVEGLGDAGGVVDRLGGHLKGGDKKGL